MKLSDVSTEKLIEAIRATEKVAKSDSPSLVALRRELERRQQAGRAEVDRDSVEQVLVECAQHDPKEAGDD